MKAWTNAEQDTAVMAYALMQRMSCHAVKFNKAAIRRVSLRQMGNTRSEGSWEAKMMNLSHAAAELGYTPVPGYAPLSGIQKSLTDKLRAQLDALTVWESKNDPADLMTAYMTYTLNIAKNDKRHREAKA